MSSPWIAAFVRAVNGNTRRASLFRYSKGSQYSSGRAARLALRRAALHRGLAQPCNRKGRSDLRVFRLGKKTGCRGIIRAVRAFTTAAMPPQTPALPGDPAQTEDDSAAPRER